MEITPLFAIDAQKMLGSGDSSGAIQLLEQGISMYPEYTTAYAVIARAFMQMRDTETAYEWVQRGLKRFPTHRALITLERDLRQQTFAGSSTKEEKKTPPSIVPASSHDVSKPAPIHEPPTASAQGSKEHDQLNNASPSPSIIVQHSQDSAPIVDVQQATAPERSEQDAQAQEDRSREESQHEEILREETGGVTNTLAENEEVSAPAELSDVSEREVLLDDALSNVDDDNDAWSHAREMVEDIDVKVADDSDEDAAPEISATPEISDVSEIPDAGEVYDTKEMHANGEDRSVRVGDAEQLMDDALSNVDDDNDQWGEVTRIVEDADTNVRSDDERDESQAKQNLSDTVNTDEVLQKINVVGGNVVMDGVFMRDVMERLELQGLRLVSTANTASRRTIRSSAMRLIPGLEYTPLRVQSSVKNHRSLSQLPDPPPFPVIRGSAMNVSPTLGSAQASKSSRKTSKTDRTSRPSDAPKSHLEELALRLEKVRTPVTEEPDIITTRGAAEGVEPTLVTETMAKIYEQQGFIEQAIKAYRQLARVKPDRRSEFEQRIAALESSAPGE